MGLGGACDQIGKDSNKMIVRDEERGRSVAYIGRCDTEANSGANAGDRTVRRELGYNPFAPVED